MTNDIIIASKHEAEDRAERIRTALSVSWDLIKDAWRSFDWQALGYPSWDAYCDGEFGTSRIRLPREERREVVSSMREIGMSTRAIASGIGTSQDTVNRALSASGERNRSPITGTDGKSYPASRPERPRATAIPQSDLDALNDGADNTRTPEPEDDPEPPEWEHVAQLSPAATEAVKRERDTPPKITVPADEETEKDRLVDLMTHIRKATKEIEGAVSVARRIEHWDAGQVSSDLRTLLNELDTTLTTGGLDGELARLIEGDQK